jgi:demethylmenaquinone methyltransferase/2-methoxy-6-polyprenyl-1,4-benzoquinol methylase
MKKKEIVRVKADEEDIKKMYSKFSKFTRFLEGVDDNLRKRALKLLNIDKGEIVLEIGFGRGNFLLKLAKEVGKEGKVYGIDITPEMVKVAKKKIIKEGLTQRVILTEGDAKKLPYNNDMFDLVYIESTLELFDTPDIPKVLNEIKRVMKPSGRLCVVSIPRKDRENSFGVKYYEWIHKLFPKYASCRPIYIKDILKETGFIIKESEQIGNVFAMKIVIARIN